MQRDNIVSQSLHPFLPCCVPALVGTTSVNHRFFAASAHKSRYDGAAGNRFASCENQAGPSPAMRFGGSVFDLSGAVTTSAPLTLVLDAPCHLGQLCDGNPEL